MIFNTGLYDESRRNVYYGLLERSENAGGTPYSFYAWRPEKHIPEWKGELPKAVSYLTAIQPYNPQLEHKIDFEHIKKFIAPKRFRAPVFPLIFVHILLKETCKLR